MFEYDRLALDVAQQFSQQSPKTSVSTFSGLFSEPVAHRREHEEMVSLGGSQPRKTTLTRVVSDTQTERRIELERGIRLRCQFGVRKPRVPGLSTSESGRKRFADCRHEVHRRSQRRQPRRKSACELWRQHWDDCNCTIASVTAVRFAAAIFNLTSRLRTYIRASGKGNATANGFVKASV